MKFRNFLNQIFSSFYSMTLLLRALDSIKKVNQELKRKFHLTLDVWNDSRF